MAGLVELKAPSITDSFERGVRLGEAVREGDSRRQLRQFKMDQIVDTLGRDKARRARMATPEFAEALAGFGDSSQKSTPEQFKAIFGAGGLEAWAGAQEMRLNDSKLATELSKQTYTNRATEALTREKIAKRQEAVQKRRDKEKTLFINTITDMLPKDMADLDPQGLQDAVKRGALIFELANQIPGTVDAQGNPTKDAIEKSQGIAELFKSMGIFEDQEQQVPQRPKTPNTFSKPGDIATLRKAHSNTIMRLIPAKDKKTEVVGNANVTTIKDDKLRDALQRAVLEVDRQSRLDFDGKPLGKDGQRLLFNDEIVDIMRAQGLPINEVVAGEVEGQDGGGGGLGGLIVGLGESLERGLGAFGGKRNDPAAGAGKEDGTGSVAVNRVEPSSATPPPQGATFAVSKVEVLTNNVLQGFEEQFGGDFAPSDAATEVARILRKAKGKVLSIAEMQMVEDAMEKILERREIVAASEG